MGGGRKHKKLADVDGTRRRPTSHRHRRQRFLGNVVVGVDGRQARRQFFDGIGISRPFLNLGARDFSFANIRNGRSHCCGGWSTRPTSSSAGGKFLPYDPYCSAAILKHDLSQGRTTIEGRTTMPKPIIFVTPAQSDIYLRGKTHQVRKPSPSWP